MMNVAGCPNCGMHSIPLPTVLVYLFRIIQNWFQDELHYHKYEMIHGSPQANLNKRINRT